MTGGVFEGKDWNPTPGRLSDVMKVIRELNPDVLGLQETLSFQKRKKVKSCVISELRKIYPHEVIFDDDIDEEPFKTWGTGCALFSKIKPYNPPGVNGKVMGVIIKGKTRAVEMKFGDVSISCVYLSHENEYTRREQIEPVLAELDDDTCSHRIIMGDFNAISPKDINTFALDELGKLRDNPKTDEKYFKRITKKRNQTIITYEDSPITDTIEAVYKEKYVDAALKYYTRKGLDKKGLRDKTAHCEKDSVAIRMDYFFVTENILPSIYCCDLRKDDFVQKASDHFPWELILDDSLFNQVK